jgi:putative transcriptional regulator
MKDQDFERLIKSVKQAGEIKRGSRRPSRKFEFKATDIKTIRIKLDVSQPEFARMIGVSSSTVKNWEQGRRKPTGPAQALLKVAADDPFVIAKSLGYGEDEEKIA